MSWESHGFSKTGSTSGVITVEMMGQRMEMPYEADLYRDASGSIGAVAADGPQGTTWMFVSLTEAGAVYTQPAPRPGDVDIDGERLVTTPSTDRDGILAAHEEAVGDSARSDADALDAALKDAPQTAVRLAGEIMKRMAAGFAASMN
ncbi:MAG: hypothetical protein KDA24_08645 [Deltaproteobacteria bacterium]|nr:hypothetical protein [Deltaproteobacteria bacterium]